MENPYKTLNVREDATDHEIKAAYRQLARTLHPDNAAGTDNADRFIEVTKAYNVLTDPLQRKTLDLTGMAFEEDATADQREINGILVALLDETLGGIVARGGKVNENDIVKTMRLSLRTHIGDLDGEVQNLVLRREAFRKLINRIKRKGEGENFFADATKRVMDECSAELPEKQRALRLAKRAAEILNDYESVVDVVRTAQAGVYFADGDRLGRPNLSSFFNLDGIGS